LLLGVRQPAHILTQSVTVRGIVNVTALAVVDARGATPPWRPQAEVALAEKG